MCSVYTEIPEHVRLLSLDPPVSPDRCYTLYTSYFVNLLFRARKGDATCVNPDRQQLTQHSDSAVHCAIINKIVNAIKEPRFKIVTFVSDSLAAIIAVRPHFKYKLVLDRINYLSITRKPGKNMLSS